MRNSYFALIYSSVCHILQRIRVRIEQNANLTETFNHIHSLIIHIIFLIPCLPSIDAKVLSLPDRHIMRYTTIVIINFIAALLIGCTPASKAVHNPCCVSDDKDTFFRLHKMLTLSGPTIDYDTLMHLYDSITGVPCPISHVDQLLGALIEKRNDNPRIDQMILIFAAKAIGASRYRIPNVSLVLMNIMNQRQRINEWVIAFVAEAIEKYPFDIANGDELMDHLEEALRQVRSRTGPAKEYFGYHFLPPPKSSYIRDYISSIADRRTREKERICYYELIGNGMIEATIESFLKTVQMNGMSDSGTLTVKPMEYLRRQQGHIP